MRLTTIMKTTNKNLNIIRIILTLIVRNSTKAIAKKNKLKNNPLLTCRPFSSMMQFKDSRKIQKKKSLNT